MQLPRPPDDRRPWASERKGWVRASLRSGSTAQFRWELVFGAADRAGRYVHRYALPRSDPRREYEAAIAAKIVGVPSSAQQRSGTLRRLLHTGIGGSARKLQDNGWHINPYTRVS